jgi:hypothetical protein
LSSKSDFADILAEKLLYLHYATTNHSLPDKQYKAITGFQLM